MTNKFDPIVVADTNILLTRKDSARAKELDKDIENRFEEWQFRNIFEDYCDALSKVLSKNNPDTYTLMINQKEEFYDSLDLEGAPDYDDQEDILELKKYIISRTSGFLNIPENEILPAKNIEIQRFF